jgi:hypothetical protein
MPIMTTPTGDKATAPIAVAKAGTRGPTLSATALSANRASASRARTASSIRASSLLSAKSKGKGGLRAAFSCPAITGSKQEVLALGGPIWYSTGRKISGINFQMPV